MELVGVDQSPEVPVWELVWVLPNLHAYDDVATDYVALASRRSPLVANLIETTPHAATLLDAFTDEFGDEVEPMALLVRSNAPQMVQTQSAVSGFRDLVCLSVIVSSNSRLAVYGRTFAIRFSDAFEVYPWSIGRGTEKHIVAFTSAVRALHDVDEIRPQTLPALPLRTLREHDFDDTLLAALTAEWRRAFELGEEDERSRKLFRSLDMARSASKAPGGPDGSHFDYGRAISLWVSAFEILAYDGKSGFEQVLKLIHACRWQHLPPTDRTLTYRKGKIPTNAAGAIYEFLFQRRNAYLHGNPVISQDLLYKNSGLDILIFAPALYRIALGAYLDINFKEEEPADGDLSAGMLFRSRRHNFYADQQNAEKAIQASQKAANDRGTD